MTSVAKRIDGYQKRLTHEWRQWRHTKAAKKRELLFGAWLERLTAKPPDVLVGANFATYGGVRNHIQAIQRYSALTVDLAPPESVLQTVGPHHLGHDFRQRFLDFPATGIKVVHSHVFPWFIEWCQEKQKRGMRWVHTYHLNYFAEHGKEGLEPWQIEINHALINVARHADVRLSVSKWQREQFLNDYGIETNYLPNCVDVSLCDRADAKRFEKKTELQNFILYVGRNDPVKNPAEFVHLAERLPQKQFVMIGGDLTADTLRSDWGVEKPPNLHVLGTLPHAEVLDAIAACAVLVVTSKREGLPTLVMEGMALARPVVVPDEVGCREVIGDGEFGLIYVPGSIEDLADKTLQAKLENRRGNLAREKVFAEYDWRVIIPKLDAIYRG